MADTTATVAIRKLGSPNGPMVSIAISHYGSSDAGDRGGGSSFAASSSDMRLLGEHASASIQFGNGRPFRGGRLLSVHQLGSLQDSFKDTFSAPTSITERLRLG